MNVEIFFKVAITALIVLALFPYFVYIYGIWKGKKQEDVPLLEKYPPISVVISAYNEEANVEKRLENLKSCGYSDMEVIFVDDKSSDKTWETAQKYLDHFNFYYRLIGNSERMGTSKSYNNAVRAATRDIIIITDADVMFKKDALHQIVSRLMSDDRIGAVTGDLQPVPDEETTTALEHKYRSIYGRMCEWESAYDSTFNFNGGLIAFKKNAVVWINQSIGADDANIAFSTIRNGYRAVYERRAVVYEDIPDSFKVQYRQKVRRAAGILESIMANKWMLKGNRPINSFFFWRWWMYLFSPMLIFVGGIAILFDSFHHSLFSGALTVFLFVLLFFSSELSTSFFLNQFYLLQGLIRVMSGGNTLTWESTTSLQKVK